MATAGDSCCADWMQTNKRANSNLQSIANVNHALTRLFLTRNWHLRDLIRYD